MNAPQNTPAAPPSKLSEEEYSKLSYAEKRVYARQFAQTR